MSPQCSHESKRADKKLLVLRNKLVAVVTASLTPVALQACSSSAPRTQADVVDIPSASGRPASSSTTPSSAKLPAPTVVTATAVIKPDEPPKKWCDRLSRTGIPAMMPGMVGAQCTEEMAMAFLMLMCSSPGSFPETSADLCDGVPTSGYPSPIPPTAPPATTTPPAPPPGPMPPVYGRPLYCHDRQIVALLRISQVQAACTERTEMWS